MSDANPPAASGEAYVSHHFGAPPQTVFAAWTDPQQVARWWAPSGFEIPPESVQIEPRVGGRFHLDMVEVGGPGRFRFRAEIVELSEHELIVLKGRPIAGTDIGVTITRVELAAEDGGTRMTVTTGPFTREDRENAQTGWDELVVNLERVLGRDPDVPPPPKLPGVESPPPEDVLDEVPPKEELVERARPADEIVEEQPSVDELLGREDGPGDSA